MSVYGTFFSLLPAIIAIVLALITKETYGSLFIGILVGAMLVTGGNPVESVNVMLFHEEGGLIAQLQNGSHAGILVFVAILGMLVMLMNKSGGSAAFAEWAAKRIKNGKQVKLLTFLLGIMMFVDDGFNCMSVGTIMYPLTDKYRISRAKLAYIIDSTAAPICIIAPISSWAAAVSYSIPEDMDINGFSLFLRTIPYNLYALGTLVMVFLIIWTGKDYGPMRKFEDKAAAGDVGAMESSESLVFNADGEHKVGKLRDLVLPVVFLIVSCILCMFGFGGGFSGVGIVDAFANTDGARALVSGSFLTLIFLFLLYVPRHVVNFRDFMECIPGGWRSFIAPMIILIMAWTLSGMTDLLGAREFIYTVMSSTTGIVQMAFPAITFVIAVLLAFSTGTSWGTFSIMIPIVCSVFSPDQELFVIAVSACLAGAVCGDHCSPISDTTIMSSAGARVAHIDHVASQMPYASYVAVMSAVGYFIAGVIAYNSGGHAALAALPITIFIIAIGVVLRREVTDLSDGN